MIGDDISNRDKRVLAGLYLSRYDSRGIKQLGFSTFTEAFNVIGYALGSRPLNIKNYRDEFDPKFENGRKGWHKRKIRDYCLKVFQQYENLDFTAFTALIQSFFGHADDERTPSPEPSGGWSPAAEAARTRPRAGPRSHRADPVAAA